MNIVCKNCEQSYSEKYSYCPYCGQGASTKRLNFKEFLNDIWLAFTNTDKGVFRLAWELIYKPGEVARMYVDGKRTKYFNPFNFLFIMVALALYIILKFQSYDIIDTSLLDENAELTNFVLKYYNIFILIMCPVNGLFIWLLFKTYGLNYVENLVLASYLSGQHMLYNCITLLIIILIPSSKVILGPFFGILLMFWYVMALLQFYRTRKWQDVIKAFLFFVIYQVLGQGIIYISFEMVRQV